MIFTMSWRLFCTLCTIALYFCSSAWGHVQMIMPLPLRSALDPQTPPDERDYNMMAPLNADGSNFPCKSYQLDTDLRSTATYHAGETYNMALQGEATHLGGSCQLSLSYDNGASFKVIKSMIGGCPVTQSYEFTIPAQAPSGPALFAWTWVNHEGNREFYMNCAAVTIVGSSSVDKRSANAALASFPNIWIGNIRTVNQCSTVEGQDTVFPDAGTDVEYGNGMGPDSPPAEGNCDGTLVVAATNDSSGASAATSAADDGSYNSGSTDAPESMPMDSLRDSESAGALVTEVPQAAVTLVDQTYEYVQENSTVSDAATSIDGQFYEVQAGHRLAEMPAASSCIPLSTVTITITPPLSWMSSWYSSQMSTPAPSCTPVGTCNCSTGYHCVMINSCTTTCALDVTSTHPNPATSMYPTASPSSAAPSPSYSSLPPSYSSSRLSPSSSIQRSSLQSSSPSASPPPSSNNYDVTVTRTSSIYSCTAEQCLHPQVIVTVSDLPCTEPEVTVTYTANPSISQGSAASRSPPPLSSDSSHPPPSNSAMPPYATGDVSAYLPCFPGTFLCTSKTTFLTCTQLSSTWTYSSPRAVAAGMECLPLLSPCTSATNRDGACNAKPSDSPVPAGFFRDDRYVRDRPNGSCPTDGALQCASGGTGFWVCDQGGWVDMGLVAAGTVCKNGTIVAS